ncbi:MAG: trypsin-like peptidase domain-containing protein [Planctomycetota bacterium]
MRIHTILPLTLALSLGSLVRPVAAQDDGAPAGVPPAAGSGLLQRPSGLQVVETDPEELDLRMTPIVRAVQRAADSVVSIYLNHAVSLTGRRAITEGQGSGVILDDSGFVITNWHVIAPVLGNDTWSVVVKLKDGRSVDARVLSSSPVHDLALLQLQLGPGERVKPVTIGRSDQLMIGETVIAIGNPQGHANTVTSGVLSATGRSIRVQTPDGNLREYSGLLQTDAAINQGNSGGALLDITGRLIGINNAMAMGAENIGFAIPVDTMREVFENELLSSGSFATAADAAWLGLDVAEIGDRVVVRGVAAGGPAASAGIEIGDVLLEADGNPVRTRLDYARRSLTADAGRPFRLRLLRGGEELSVAPQPWTRGAGAVLAMTGLIVEEVDAEADRELAERVTRAFYQGSSLRRLPLFPAVLRVRGVQPDSPAEALRVRDGDVLMAAVVLDRFGRERDWRIDDQSKLSALLMEYQGRPLRLVVLRGDEDLVGTLDVRQLKESLRR